MYYVLFSLDDKAFTYYKTFKSYVYIYIYIYITIYRYNDLE